MRGDLGFSHSIETMKAKQDHAVMSSALAEDQLPEVLIGSNDDCLGCGCSFKHFVIGDSRAHFRDIRHVMARDAQGIHDLPLHALVAYDLQKAYVGTG